MNSFDQLANDDAIKKTMEALKDAGVEAILVETGEEAKNKVLEMIPAGAEVMNMSSVTIDTLGIAKEINESGKYDSVKAKLSKMNRETQNDEMQKLGAAPMWAIGSVHAVTQDGKVLVASNTGSQLPAYTYGSKHVIWVVGVQKIVPNMEEGLKRIYEYVLPLESERVKKAYGMEKSNVSKLFILNHENIAGRITLIFVKEKLGF